MAPGQDESLELMSLLTSKPMVSLRPPKVKIIGLGNLVFMSPQELHCCHCIPSRILPNHAILWTRQWHPTPALLPGKSHGWRSLVGCSPWGHSESDATERLHFHFSLSCIGEGNGNPLQCSCLENPRDRGAWWASVYEIGQSQTRLKRLSSSSSSMPFYICE